MRAEPETRTDVAYEKRDAYAGWILLIITFLGIGGLVMHGSLAAMYHLLLRKAPPEDAYRVSYSREGHALPYEYPRLQVSPAADLQEFEARQHAVLNQYGWIDRSNGVVRLPLDRAVDLVLERGLPTRSGPGQDQIGSSVLQMQEQKAGAETAPPGKAP